MARLTVVKGEPFETTITLKDSGTSAPITLDPSDTATMYFVNKDTGESVVSKAMTQDPTPENGKFILSLDETDTANFPVRTGFPEDGTPFLDTCRAYVEFDTVAKGHGFVHIRNVYVEEMGS